MRSLAFSCGLMAILLSAVLVLAQGSEPVFGDHLSIDEFATHDVSAIPTGFEAFDAPITGEIVDIDEHHSTFEDEDDQVTLTTTNPSTSSEPATEESAIMTSDDSTFEHISTIAHQSLPFEAHPTGTYIAVPSTSAASIDHTATSFSLPDSVFTYDPSPTSVEVSPSFTYSTIVLNGTDRASELLTSTVASGPRFANSTDNATLSYTGIMPTATSGSIAINIPLIGCIAAAIGMIFITLSS